MIPVNLVHLANHLWQSTLFVAAVWLMTLVLRENRAAVRHSLWVAASVKFLIPFSLLGEIGSRFQWSATHAPTSPVLPFLEAVGQPFGGTVTSAVSIPIRATASSTPTSSVSAVLFYMWIFGFVASLLWWATRWLQLRRAVRQAAPLNLNVPMRVLACRGRVEPGVFGIFRPVLLLPEGITDRLSPAQLQAILAHELCHVRRRDNLTAAIHMFVESLFWFHPLVWWIKVRLIDEQEGACDEDVLRSGGDPQAYAESILKICEFYLASPLICVSGIAGSNLKKRIENIMRNRVGLQLGLSRVLLLAVAATAAIAGPIIFGIANVRASGRQSEPAVPSIASPSIPKTAQFQAPPAAPARITTTASSTRGSSRAIQEYRIGEVEVTGATFIHNDVIRSLLGLLPGEGFDELRLRKGLEDLRKLYGNLGYVNFIPQPVPDFDEQRKIVNLTIHIDEGRRFTVNRIGFVGNRTTSSEVIQREIFVKEGDVFNASLLELSLLRLNQLGLFEEIKIEDVRIMPSADPSKLDIDLRVKEKER